MLTKQDLMTRKLAIRKIDIPEWGTVYIRRLAGGEQDNWEKSIKDLDAWQLKVQILLRTLCDEEGKRLFTDNDSELLNEIDGSVLVKLARLALKFNRIEEKDIKTLEENFDKTQPCSLVSD